MVLIEVQGDAISVKDHGYLVARFDLDRYRLHTDREQGTIRVYKKGENKLNNNWEEVVFEAPLLMTMVYYEKRRRKR